MKKAFIWYFIGVVVGCLMGFWLADKKCDTTIREIESVAHQVCERRVADPARCLSVCVEYFEKMGC